MYTPSATYRIQFNPSFSFQATRKIISYLAELGISTIYASPIFKARKGSTHGYDVTDPNQINPEIGSWQDFQLLIEMSTGTEWDGCRTLYPITWPTIAVTRCS